MCAPMMDREDAVVLEFCTRDCFKPQGGPAIESENEANFPETGATPGERTVKTIATDGGGRWKKITGRRYLGKCEVGCSMLLRQRKEMNSDKYGCHPRKSYFEAIDICRNKGLRLCTLEEAK